MTVRFALVLAGLAMLPEWLPAQSVWLRFDPPDGAVFTRLFQIHTRVVRDGAAGSREAAELGGVREVALRGRADAPLVHLSYDSLRTRLREGAGPWRELAAADDSAWAQVRFDERLTPTVIASGGPGPGAARLVALITGLPGLVLPPHAVRAGDSWMSRLMIPVPVVELGATGGEGVVLESRATVTVDSVVGRARDTLAYLSVEGAIPTVAFGPDVFAGAVRGALVWSTGWQSFVSGATRTRVEARPGGGSRAIVMETTVRQQVRPTP